MNQKLLALIVCLLAPLFAVAQNNYARINYLGSSKSSRMDIARMDDAGNAYVVINTAEDAEVRGMSFKKRGTNYSVITKVAANGNLQWGRTLIIQTGADVVTDLQVDKDQNVYLAGYGTDVKLDDGSTLNPGPFLIKLNKAGETLWGIGPDDNQAQVTVPNLITLSNGGVYWSAAFVKRLRIQSRSIPANDPVGGSADAFVAFVSTGGQIAGVYHHNVQGAVVQVLTTIPDGSAVAVFSNGANSTKLNIDQPCNATATQTYFGFKNDRPQVRATSYGQQLFAYAADNSGFYDVRLDDQLNITSANKLFPAATGNGDMVTDGIGFDASTSFLTRNNGDKQDWLKYDGNMTTLLAENTNGMGRQVYTRSFIKVVDDTVHMLIKHLDPSATSYNFYGQTYNDKSAGTDGYFWIKYVYKTTDPCLKLVASVATNGVEGSQDAKIKVTLPTGCVAAEDLTINLSQIKPTDNQGDFVLPPNLIIKKGESSAEVTIKILDDNDLESEERFDIRLTLAATTNAYQITSGAKLTFTITDNDNSAANRVFNVSYQSQVTEGGSADITVSLQPNVKFTEALTLSFEPDGSAFSASSGTDHNAIVFTLPAGSNSVTFKVNALSDKLIEGDEFISGKIIATNNGYGAFTSSTNTIRIKIIDADNTANNRIIDITPATSTLTEGGSNTYLFKIASGYGTQYPLNISTQQLQWQAFIKQTTAALQLDETIATAALTINYADDDVIRSDKAIKLGLTTADNHAGTFRFRWNGQIIDALNITAVDNDAASAKLLTTPTKLTLSEGQPANITLQIADGKSFEDNIIISYAWGGANIGAETRIADKGPLTATMVAGQTKLSVPVSVNNDQKINPNNNYQISFSAKDASGRMITADPQNIAVTIFDDDASSLKIPLVFTPNGDGINDVWNIEGLSLDARASVNIFDRSGGVIYQSNGYSTAWDGTIKGSPLPPGTYYYRIIGFNRSQAGSVTIIR